MKKSLLLISARPEDQSFASEIARANALSLVSVRDMAEGAELIEQTSPSLIFCDISSAEDFALLEREIQEKVGLFSDKVDPNRIHLISTEDLEEAPFILESPLFGHFIIRDVHDPISAGRRYARISGSALLERPFGLSNWLAEGTKIQTLSLKMSNHKQEAVEAIRGYLLAAQFNNRMATQIANAVDEMLMNAIFDAPVDELGKQKMAATPRTAVFPLEAQQTVEVQIGFDGEFFGLTAIDHFGSVEKSRLIKHISKVYTEDEYKVRTTTAGAGIGLSTVFRNGGSFVFVVEQGRRTEATVLFKKTSTFREFKEQFRSFSALFYV